jgi:glycosyltransferase involved in cell wall biosynthesis
MTTALPSLPFLPVFIISFNRGPYLQRVIASYRKQDIDLDIIVHDNGSTEAQTKYVLSELSAAGVRIYRYRPIVTPEELDNVDASVRRYEAETGYSGPYIVTDCDVDISDARPDTFRTYLELLDQFHDVECVGPMLKIDDIPRSYPLFDHVMGRHIAQFWHKEPEWVEISVGRIAYLRHKIDTTLAVHRENSRFRRLKDGLRLYHPFEARHLDWYVSADLPNAYRGTSSPLISHWDNETEWAKHRHVGELIANYRVVIGEIGRLSVVTKSTCDNPTNCSEQLTSSH